MAAPVAVPVPVAVHRISPFTSDAEAFPLTGIVLKHRAVQVPATPLAVTSVTFHEKSVHTASAVEAATDPHDPPNDDSVVSPVSVGTALRMVSRQPETDWARMTVARQAVRNICANLRLALSARRGGLCRVAESV